MLRSMMSTGTWRAAGQAEEAAPRGGRAAWQARRAAAAAAHLRQRPACLLATPALACPSPHRRSHRHGRSRSGGLHRDNLEAVGPRPQPHLRHLGGRQRLPQLGVGQLVRAAAAHRLRNLLADLAVQLGFLRRRGRPVQCRSMGRGARGSSRQQAEARPPPLLAQGAEGLRAPATAPAHQPCPCGLRSWRCACITHEQGHIMGCTAVGQQAAGGGGGGGAMLPPPPANARSATLCSGSSERVSTAGTPPHRPMQIGEQVRCRCCCCTSCCICRGAARVSCAALPAKPLRSAQAARLLSILLARSTRPLPGCLGRA